MIVDDDQLVLTLLARMLHNQYNVSQFMDARSALTAIETGKIPDVIISDIMMPEMDGQAFYEEIRKLGSYSTRFLFITGGAVTEESLEFERNMAVLGRLLLKPFEADQLHAALNETLTLQGALEYEHEACPEKRLATSPKAGYPDPSRLSELEEYVSLDILRSQYQKLHGQMQHLIANAPQLEIEELAYNAHKLAGAAGMLGISDIAYRLRGCQNAAAVGDRGEATSQLAEIPALTAAFATFVAGYALK
ncbi:response regulator [Paracoccaceae bacterium]|nr:response regulator [Paracoccaceae bacterium]